GTTRPAAAPDLTGLTGDVTRGEVVFHAAGCASCHAAPRSEGEAKLILAGGQAFPSDFGTFYAPNISPDPEAGIGSWSASDLARAVQKGVSPRGKHYFPAFPYTAYALAEAQDIVDLHAYMATLPADATPSQAHDVSFPFSIRRNLGGWKLLFGRPQWVLGGDGLSETVLRGRYLSEAMAHCGECHTPRNALGGLDRSRWLAGAPDPSGKGRVPNITPAALDWSEEDIAYYLESGFTPEFDSVGGHMASVVENMAQLTPEDRAAIAAYLKAVPPVANP
ncbi:MAG: cytochrome c, partial [Pseudomonadota bacterium]